jgi:CheY-like chemotaxis protein
LALQHLLESQGIRVLLAADGLAGVTMARVHLPDLVVMDIEMPGMNGIEACREIKADFVTQEIPVIMLTASTDLDVVDAGLGAGALDFIPKDALSGPVLLDSLASLQLLDEVGEAS